MTSLTTPSQILDRSVLMARYRAARAAGNDVRATAILAVVNYLDRRSRARLTAGRPPLYPSAADFVDSLLRLSWWWAAPAPPPTQQASLH